VRAFWKTWKFDRALERMDRQPLVMRELHEGLRRKSTLRLRKAFGGTSLALITWTLLVWQSDAIGQQIFQFFCLFAFAGCLVAGIFLGGDSLSKERREGTLPLLFLSSLSSGEVVLGKFAANTLIPAFTLIGMLPSLTVCLLVGGVTGAEVFRAMLAIPPVLLWAMALALLTSGYCADQRAALGSALLSIAGMLFAGPLLANMFRSFSFGWLSFLFYSLSPLTLISNIEAGRYVSNAGLYWTSLFSTLIATYGFLLWTTAHISGSWRLNISEQRSEVKMADCEPESQSEPAAEPAGNPKIAADHAITWLVSRYKSKPIVPILITIAALIIWITARQIPAPRVWTPPSRPTPNGAWIPPIKAPGPVFLLRREVVPLIALQLLHLAFKVWIAFTATQVFTADRRSGALEMLLGSTLADEEIVSGVVHGLKRRFRMALLLLLSADLLFALTAFSQQHLLLGAGSIMLGILLWVDVEALIWAGLIEGLLGRIPFWSIVMTLWRMLGIPALICGAMPAIFFGRSLPVGLAIWFPLTLASTLWAIRSVKQQYLPHFRPIALQFFGNTPPAIESPWSFVNWEEEEPANPEPILISA
jgi:ABC-type transport system involved in multi-copper enzyme maturation permease subunit